MRDGDAARAWYERLWGRPADMLPQAGEAVWRLTGEGLVYVVEDASRAGGGLVTVAVDDLATQLAALEAHGIAAELTPHARGPRRAIVRDPDGNTITFFEHARSAG